MMMGERSWLAKLVCCSAGFSIFIAPPFAILGAVSNSKISSHSELGFVGKLMVAMMLSHLDIQISPFEVIDFGLFLHRPGFDKPPRALVVFIIP